MSIKIIVNVFSATDLGYTFLVLPKSVFEGNSVVNDFQDWVESIGGPNEAAKRIGCTSRAVRKWVDRECMPRVDFLQKIVKAARGKLTIESVIKSIKKPGK